MLLKIYPNNPDERKVKQILEALNAGEVIIIPTDGVYAFACLSTKNRGIEEMAQLKGVKAEKAEFSFLFHSLSQLALYTKPITTTVYKIMKKALPGPYTFIVDANTAIPKIFKNKKTIGIRIPDHPICLYLAEQLEAPLLLSSVHDVDDLVEYTTDPELIDERFGTRVAYIIDGGFGQNEPSTVVDCTDDQVQVIREGLGEVFF